MAQPTAGTYTFLQLRGIFEGGEYLTNIKAGVPNDNCAVYHPSRRAAYPMLYASNTEFSINGCYHEFTEPNSTLEIVYDARSAVIGDVLRGPASLVGPRSCKVLARLSEYGLWISKPVNITTNVTFSSGALMTFDELISQGYTVESRAVNSPASITGLK